MKVFDVNYMYTTKRGYKDGGCAIVHAENEEQAKELLQKHFNNDWYGFKTLSDFRIIEMTGPIIGSYDASSSDWHFIHSEHPVVSKPLMDIVEKTAG